MASEAQLIGTQSLAVKAALAGGQEGQSSWVGPWSPWCDNPIWVERRVTSRQAHDAKKIGNCKISDMLKSLEVAIQVPCRRCEKCLKFRQCEWRERAVAECGSANRTWWMCLTFSPIHLAGILVSARSDSVKDIERVAYRAVQKYFKRLRKAGAVFRYFAVYERGDLHGRSHYHLLLHETGSRPISNETLQDLWPSNVWVRLLGCEDAGRTSSYITKYATKSLDIRPRASVKYGQTSFPSKPSGFGGKNSLIFGEKTTTPPTLPTKSGTDFSSAVGSCFEQTMED